MSEKHPSDTRLAIKFLDAEGRGPQSRFRWPQPGEWVQAIGELSLCHNGIHAATLAQALTWCDASAWLIELDGEIIEADGKLCARRGRLVRRLDAWDERSARLLAADYAERVLPIFERERPRDARPRKAIEAARAYARGEIHAADRDAAGDAAWDASWGTTAASVAARAAVWTTAREAARVAVRDAARLAALAAQVDAANPAAADAEREWQVRRLADCLGLTSDELDALQGGSATMTEAQSLRQVIAQTSKAVRTGPIELRRAAEVAASAAMTDNTEPERGDEVVLRLTREEVQVLIGRAELPVGGVATLDNRIRTPLGDKLRAALDQGGSDEAEQARAKLAQLKRSVEVMAEWPCDGEPGPRCPDLGKPEELDHGWCPSCRARDVLASLGEQEAE